jgi:hypothetical protein
MGDLGVRRTGVLARIGLGCSDTPTEQQFDAVAACGRHGCGERQVRSVSSSPAGPMIARRDRLAPSGAGALVRLQGGKHGPYGGRARGGVRASIRQKGEGDFDTMLEDLDFRGFAGCRAVRALAIGLPMRGRGVIAISSRSPPLVALRIRWDQRFESSSLPRRVFSEPDFLDHRLEARRSDPKQSGSY